MKRFALSLSLALGLIVLAPPYVTRHVGSLPRLRFSAQPLLASTTIQNKYGTSNQTVTITLAGLTNGSREQSVCIDNSTNLFQDILVFVQMKTGAANFSGLSYAEVFAGGTVDGGTTWTSGATASGGCTTDTSITLTAPPNINLIGTINTPNNATSYFGGPYSMASAFNGTLPQKVFLVIGNQGGTSATWDSTGANFAVIYQGVESQSQ